MTYLDRSNVDSFKSIFQVVIHSALCLAFLILPPKYAQAQRLQQHLGEQDYCGPEGSKLARYVPERVIVDFRSSCAAHDSCYSSVASDVRRMIEQRNQASLVRATPELKRAFRLEMTNLKLSCDRRFLVDLRGACRSAALALRPACDTAAITYFDGVRFLARGAFDRAVDAAFVDRDR